MRLNILLCSRVSDEAHNIRLCALLTLVNDKDKALQCLVWTFKLVGFKAYEVECGMIRREFRVQGTNIGLLRSGAGLLEQYVM